MSSVRLIHHPDYIALLPAERCKVLSSAVLNGGLQEANALLNMRVDKHAPLHCLAPEQTLLKKVEELSLPAATIGMMTAASMQSLGQQIEHKDDLTVACWVTSGLSNVRRVGDKADDNAVPGTINICLYINQALSDAALAEALILLTESKVTAIRDAEIISPVSGLPASGTGTDSHAVFCPDAEPQHAYCGKHTTLGELIGRVVLQACSISLNHCLRSLAENE
ncbi:adenosylcobinamide amidohydrolase [Methylophaga sulfidovorans]|uniref:Adenosylcobinamide amidohydrolase n=1 Tax=Methylophaga sulfidovorans TaxID=45496 RepID=A0A1I3XYC4_9GAMM|nr:adenosylcobinamide amidohydrolase [Methylophaga sulfidovorans]SFK24502.1 Adenosylcobinamide amidohydrolase [Methylophaga sulfidovorans]